MAVLLKQKHSLDSAKVALEWFNRGIIPVPLQHRSKSPIKMKGWQDLRVTPETIPRFFRNGNNVGGLWGEPSNWIVDIDLDTDESAHVAPYFLPNTFVYGRQKRPATHYLIRCKGVTTQSRRKKDGSKSGKKVVEIRSTGSQSVLPPSIHPDDGDRYQIDERAEIADMPRAQLERAADYIAAASILYECFPSKGSRHDFIHALAGALMHSGWKLEDAQDFMERFLESTSDVDEEPDDRKRTIANTFEHFKKGDRVMGWTTLRDFLEPDDLKTIRQWLVPPRTFAKVPVAGPDDLTIRIPPMPKALIEVPGLVGEIAEWSGRCSYRKQPAFDIATGLMCTAFAAANKYVVDGWHTPLQPYFLLVAPTAAGKDYALTNVFRFAHKIKLGDNVFQGFQSPHVLFDKLAESSLAVWLMDEAARRLLAARSPNSLEFTILTSVLQLYGKANQSVAQMPGRKLNIQALDHPCLQIFAAAQPGQLMEAVGTVDLATGFVNRFMLFDSGDQPAVSNLQRDETFPSRLRRAALEMKQAEPDSLPIAIRFENTSTWAMFRDFEAEATGYASEDGANTIWGRANQNALMIAGITAVGVNSSRPLISLEIARWAIELVRWSASCWAARIGESASRTGREKHSKDVERRIRNVRIYASKAPKPYRSLMSRGFMPRVMVLRHKLDIEQRMLQDILDQLVAAGMVDTGDVEETECFWAVR